MRHGRRTELFVWMPTLLAALLVPAPAIHAAGRSPRSGDQAVAYQIDVAHSGYSQTPLTPPLIERWRRQFKGAVSYPLIADGKVFITEAGTSSYGTWLHALDAATGDPWWSVYLNGVGNWSNAAYDAGKVFTMNNGDLMGILRAFDAATGAELWRRRLSGVFFDAPPTASGGVVYVSGGLGLTAIDEEQGRFLWRQIFEAGDQSSPALSSDGVFVSYACPLVFEFDRFTGDQIWTYDQGCHGGGGRTAVYHQDRLWVRDDTNFPAGYLFDATDGTLLDRYPVDPAPAFFGDVGFFLIGFGESLVARDLVQGRRIWEFTGDGDLTSAPIVVNGFVYEGSAAGNLYALDAATGDQVWSVGLGVPIPAPDEFSAAQPLTGFGAGEGVLVIAAGGVLVAFGQ